MKIIGISASCRKWGNTEILVKHALKGASTQGAETRFLRLTDMDIGQCTGCFACMRKSIDCVQKDKLAELVKQIRQSDGVVLGSPVYFLSSAGSVQMLIPRFFRMTYTEEFKDKPGLVLIAAGGPGWETFAVPQVSLFFKFLGMPVVDHVIGYGQGPGEVFFDETACRRAEEGGAAMARGEKNFRGLTGTCPVCHLDFVSTRPDGSANCMVCDLPGKWNVDGKTMRFVPAVDQKSRIAPGQIRKHFEEDVLTSAEAFINRKQSIQEKLKLFKDTILKIG